MHGRTTPAGFSLAAFASGAKPSVASAPTPVVGALDFSKAIKFSAAEVSTPPMVSAISFSAFGNASASVPTTAISKHASSSALFGHARRNTMTSYHGKPTHTSSQFVSISDQCLSHVNSKKDAPASSSVPLAVHGHDSAAALATEFVHKVRRVSLIF